MMHVSSDFLDNLVKDVRRVFLDDRIILSFEEYMDLVCANPDKHVRSSAQYLVDMLDHFGSYQVDLPYGTFKRFALFDAPFGDDSGFIAGHEAVQEALYRSFANFAREGRVNKLVLLHGPNGSAKSSLCRSLMAGMEAYGRTKDGAMYSYNWIFPSERINGTDRIGFGGKKDDAFVSKRSFAYLPVDSIDARIPCDMHDHPLFLIPPKQRLPLLEKLTADGHTVISDYLRYGDLCYKCRRIYDALLISYEGNIQQVLNHVQIERFYPSRRYRRGISTIEPQFSIDARFQQITADRSPASLPKSLQHTSLFEPAGPLVDANRGLIEYSDLLKRPVDAFKYLLSTVETATVSLDSFLLHVDMVFIASTNETYLEAFKEHPDFSSFKGRMELIKVPYVLRYSDEKRIYQAHVKTHLVGRHVAPHAIDVAAMWAILTRMRRNDATLYPRDMTEIIRSLTPLEKLCLYDHGDTPERLLSHEAKALRSAIPQIYKETLAYPRYEGCMGASAREIHTALFNAAHDEHFKCLHPFAVFEEIKNILASKSVYDFLKQDIVGLYHDHVSFLDETEKMYLQWIDNEVRHAMGLATDKSYVELFHRYVTHVSYWVKNEKWRDPNTGKLRDPDEGFMSDIESVLMSPGEKKEDFRRSVIGTIGARALENPDAYSGDAASTPDYRQIFKHYITQLHEDFYAKHHPMVAKIIENFLKYVGSEAKTLDYKEQEQVIYMLDQLKTKHGYCNDCARDTIAYLYKKRYTKLQN